MKLPVVSGSEAVKAFGRADGRILTGVLKFDSAYWTHLELLRLKSLEEKDGHDWIDKLPRKIKEYAETRRDGALKDSWLEGEKSDLLGFADFGHLAEIIVAKWDYFKDVVPTQHWLKQRMDELEKSRNFIAHNRMLLPSQLQRLYMYIADWNRVIGL